MKKREKVQVKLDNLEALASTLKALIGIGFLSVPLPFKQCGIIGGILGTLLIVCFGNISNYFLFRLISKIGIKKGSTIGSLAKHTIGIQGRNIVEAIILCA